MAGPAYPGANLHLCPAAQKAGPCSQGRCSEAVRVLASGAGAYALFCGPGERIAAFSNKTQALDSIVLPNFRFRPGTVTGIIIPVLPLSK